MKFVIRVYKDECFIGDAYVKNITEAKRKASKMCNNYAGKVDKFIICGGEHDGITFYRRNKITPWNEIIRGEWN